VNVVFEFFEKKTKIFSQKTQKQDIIGCGNLSSVNL